MTLSKGQLQPIGGYFELELPTMRELPHAKLQYYQSARAGFLALLRAGRPERVWMRRYICNEMLTPLENIGIEFTWYDLTNDFEVDPEVNLKAGDWLLYVNYFGLCGAKVQSLIRRLSPEQIVLDYSQAFFAPPDEQALATIYSPRKFFGVPDGGLLYSQIPISTPEEVDETPFNRMEHLIRRLVDSPEDGYAAYQKSEKSLVDIEPRTMSNLTKRILASIDFDAVRRIRKENFNMLNDWLGGGDGGLLAEMDETEVPLCYPYHSRDVGLRQRLLNHRVFVATYWSDALDRLKPDSADKLVRDMFPLPIDQRYGAADMERISAIILDNK